MPTSRSGVRLEPVTGTGTGTGTGSPSRLRRLSAIGIGIVISFGFLVLIFTQIDLSEVLAELSNVNLGIVSLSQGTIFVGFLMMTLRSKVLLRPLHRYSFYRLFRSVLVGFAVVFLTIGVWRFRYE